MKIFNSLNIKKSISKILSFIAILSMLIQPIVFAAPAMAFTNPRDVTFNYNYSGAPASTIVTIEKGTNVTKPSDPVRSGYNFLDWCKKADGTQVWDFTTNINNDLTLYAKWAVATDTTNPIITSVTGTTGTTGENTLVTVIATDNALAKAQISINGSAYADMTGSASPFTYNVAVPSNSTASINYQVKVIDSSNNFTTSSVKTITVTDNDKPIINVSPFIATIDQGSVYNLMTGVSAIDNIDFVVNVAPSGSVNYAIPGSYFISYNAIDFAGNAAATVTREVIVQKTSDPEITVSPSSINIEAFSTYGATEAMTGVSAKDFKNSDITANVIADFSAVNTDSVGSYSVNYSVTDSNGNSSQNTRTVNVIPKVINVTANNQSKTYGQTDPILSYTNDQLNGSDIFSGYLTRVAGEDVGEYAIEKGNLSAGPNYDIHFTGANLTISTAKITVTADPQTKIYGEVDPVLTYKVIGSLVGSDTFSGTLTRTTGEDIGKYTIGQDTLKLSANYELTYVSDNLEITAKEIDVAVVANSKIYGETDPGLSYVSDPLVGSDLFTGLLVRETGEDAGIYKIKQGSLSAGDNYEINFTGADFTIDQLKITATIYAATKVYGSIDPIFTYKTPSGALLNGDTLSGTLTRALGEKTGKYAISGVLTNPNYEVTVVPADLTITKAPITIAADAKTKISGAKDPIFTYAVTFGKLIGTDNFTGSLERVAGETAGNYLITKGTLTLGDNYDLTLSGTAGLTIDPALDDGAVLGTNTSRNTIQNTNTPTNDESGDVLGAEIAVTAYETNDPIVNSTSDDNIAGTTKATTSNFFTDITFGLYNWIWFIIATVIITSGLWLITAKRRNDYER